MFSTLRHANLGDPHLILEPTGAPFDRNRRNKTVRRACVRCRSKKVKCTGEKDGCRGCLKSNRECCYTYSQKSGSSLETSPRLALAPRMAMLPSPPATERPVPDPMQQQQQQQHEERESDILGSSSISLPDESPVYNFSSNLGRDCDAAAGERYLNRMYGDMGSSFGFHDVFFDNPLDTSVATVATASSELPTPTTTSADSCGSEPLQNVLRRECGCPKRTMRTYEMVEICLVWAPRDESRTLLPLGADEMLRYQKEALVNCESTLRCGVCSLEPEQIMLMISICNKLLASIVEMRDTLPAAACEQQQQRGSTETLRQHEQRWPSPISIPTGKVVTHHNEYILDGQEWSTGTQGHDDCSSNRGIDGRRRPSVLGIDQWKIDDEDKLQILKSLSDDRARRLKNLVAMMGEVAASNHWMAHRSMIQDLSKRFAKEVPFID